MLSRHRARVSALLYIGMQTLTAGAEPLESTTTSLLRLSRRHLSRYAGASLGHSPSRGRLRGPTEPARRGSGNHPTRRTPHPHFKTLAARTSYPSSGPRSAGGETG